MIHTEDLQRSGISFPAWMVSVDRVEPEKIVLYEGESAGWDPDFSYAECCGVVVDYPTPDEVYSSSGITTFLRRVGEVGKRMTKVHSEEEAIIEHVRSGKPCSLVRDWRPYRFGQYGVWRICSYTETKATAVGMSDGAGPRSNTCCSIRCVWGNGREFNITSFANDSVRQDLWDNKHLVIGKKVRLVYKETSKLFDVPIRAMFIEVIEDE